MSQHRKLIRLAITELLKGHTSAGANVYPSRSSAIWQSEEVPAICVYTGEENIEVFDVAPRRYRRELQINVELVVHATKDQDAEDMLDDLGHEVEREIGRSDDLTYAKERQVSDIILTGTRSSLDSSGEKIIGALVISYLATYYTYEPDEFDEDPVDALRRVNTDYSLGGTQQPADRAEDQIEVAQ
jgi:hypothetical protein